MSYFQGSIFMTIFTFLTMAAFLALTIVTLIGAISESVRSKMYFALYLTLFIWWMGIMIDAYVTAKQNSWSKSYDMKKKHKKIDIY
jgi:hypothetical protein